VDAARPGSVDDAEPPGWPDWVKLNMIATNDRYMRS